MKRKLTDNPIAHMRRNYTRDGLLEEDLEETAIDQFTNWFTDARKSKIIEPNAMTLATSNKSGLATARIVLLKALMKKDLFSLRIIRVAKEKKLQRPKKELFFSSGIY